MKILFIITSLANGGAERVCATLANYFSKDNECEILYFDDKVFYPLNKEVKLSLANSDKKGISRLFDKLKIIRQKCNENDINIAFMDSTNILSIIANIFSGNKIIISEHSQHDFLGFKWRILRRIFYPFAYALSVLSRRDYDYFSFVKNKAVIYNPVSFAPLASKAEKKNLIIFVGRLESVKGCAVFLKALALLDLTGFEVRVLGDGTQRKPLKEIAKNLGLNVIFLGNIKDIEKHYEEAKILVSSSLYEGLGNALIESSFFDCIRVSTPTFGACELICDEKDGFISKDFSPDSLASSIKKALNITENQRQNITKNARQNCDKFLIENIAKQWMELMK